MNENLGHKTFYMTRFIFISILFQVIISLNSYIASAGIKKSNSVTISDISHSENDHSAKEPVSKTVPFLPATKSMPPMHTEEKAHSAKVEELPHIHHFHKERLKKIKRHHQKCWTLSKVLLVLCHIAILLMAYSHVTH